MKMSVCMKPLLTMTTPQIIRYMITLRREKKTISHPLMLLMYVKITYSIKHFDFIFQDQHYKLLKT